MHPELINTEKTIYHPCHFQYSKPIPESESVEYGAYIFKLNTNYVRFRVAKITPTKVGQFVTLWKRVENKSIQPYDMTDDIDFCVVVTRKDNNLGQFIFPKSVLQKHDIVSTNHSGGKRAIRVYPPWDIVLNKQAIKTQKWQLEYFLEMPLNEAIDYTRARKLYCM